CFLLPSGRPFKVASDLSVPPIDAKPLLEDMRRRGTTLVSSGTDDFFLISSRFEVDRDQAGMLLSILPPIVHIKKETEQTALRWSIERLMQEMHEQQPGNALVAQHLAHMMLVQALRACLSEGMKGNVGWLFALADKQIGATINAMHADPAHRWTL